jgi:DNA-binding MarR family transcriptional regulator
MATQLKHKTASSTLLAEELYRHVNRARRLLWTTAAGCLEEQGESIFTWQVLCTLARYGAKTQRELAYATAQHPAGLSRLLDELEADKLIVRKPDPADRRKLLVSATPKGKARFEAASPPVWRGVDEALAVLTPTQRQDLRNLLAIIVPLDAPLKKKAAS